MLQRRCDQSARLTHARFLLALALPSLSPSDSDRDRGHAIDREKEHAAMGWCNAARSAGGAFQESGQCDGDASTASAAAVRDDELSSISADLRLIVPSSLPCCYVQNNYVHVAQRMAEQLAAEGKTRVLYADQWGNLANRRSHIATTGPEIWAQTGGRIDAFSCATGTGGTLTGVGTFLKSRNPSIHIALTDPRGAVLVRWFNEGVLKAEGDSISEGIGQGRITGNMAADSWRPDIALEVHDAPAMAVAYDLLEKEGLCVGTSSAINVAGAMEVAKRMPKGSTIVTVICDSGTRYASKMFNPGFLRSRNLPVPRWMDTPSEAEADTQAKLQEMLKKAMQPQPQPAPQK